MTSDASVPLYHDLPNVTDAEKGLPDEVFRFALSIVPMINVDLMTVDAARGVLLAWREDEFGSGWHLPGSIIRLNEAISHRVAETARVELAVPVAADPAPIAIYQLFGDRGHFISLLFKCHVQPGANLVTVDPNERQLKSGDLAWFNKPPVQPYPAHAAYIQRLPAFNRNDPVGLSEPPVDLRGGAARSSY